MQINKKLDLEINKKKITISRSDLRILSKTSYAHMYSIYLDLKLFHLYQEQKTWRYDWQYGSAKLCLSSGIILVSFTYIYVQNPYEVAFLWMTFFSLTVTCIHTCSLAQHVLHDHCSLLVERRSARTPAGRNLPSSPVTSLPSTSRRTRCPQAPPKRSDRAVQWWRQISDSRQFALVPFFAMRINWISKSSLGLTFVLKSCSLT